MIPVQKTIIVVEDEPDAAEMFSEMMRVSGFRVLKASGSAPAINMIAKEEPAAVILDIMMPDISGLEAGASIYLTKPVDYLDLKQAMEKVLAG
jgi:DNA-binding response OmpR family regulator